MAQLTPVEFNPFTDDWDNPKPGTRFVKSKLQRPRPDYLEAASMLPGLWYERLKDAVLAPGRAAKGELPVLQQGLDPETGMYTGWQATPQAIEAAQGIAGLMGSGTLASPHVPGVFRTGAGGGAEHAAAAAVPDAMLAIAPEAIAAGKARALEPKFAEPAWLDSLAKELVEMEKKQQGKDPAVERAVADIKFGKEPAQTTQPLTLDQLKTMPQAKTVAALQKDYAAWIMDPSKFDATQNPALAAYFDYLDSGKPGGIAQFVQDLRAKPEPQWAKPGWEAKADPQEMLKSDWLVDSAGKYKPMDLDNPSQLAAAAYKTAEVKHPDLAGNDAALSSKAADLLQNYKGDHDADVVKRALGIVNDPDATLAAAVPINKSDIDILLKAPTPEIAEDALHKYGTIYAKGKNAPSEMFKGLDALISPEKSAPKSIPIATPATPAPAAPQFDFSHVQPTDWASHVGEDLLAMPAGARARAKEMGFNTNLQLYKGMNREIEGEGFLDPALTKGSERAQFATDSPRIANEYTSGGGQITPLLSRAEKPYVVDWTKFNQGSPNYNGQAMHRLIEHVRQQGGDAVVIKQIGDMGGMQTQYAFLDPNKLRSPFAKFDPARKYENNLLAAQGSPIFLTPVDTDPFGDSQ